MQKRLYDIGQPKKNCRGFKKGDGTEKHRLYHCRSWREVRNQIAEVWGDWEQRTRTSKKYCMEESHRTLQANTFGGRATCQSKSGIRRAQKVNNARCEGLWNRVTSGNSLLEVSGRWSACGWSVVQLDHDKEMELMRGAHCTLDSELEVQRTIKRQS